jgi:nitroimidazol reductase NimA-like FMN-containing flavoprotein (pyridoxamine 5'-phosphate oxidase superfamily)
VTWTGPGPRVRRLDAAECWRRLRGHRLGRIAFVVDGRVEIQPMHYVVQERRIVMRTTAEARLVVLRHRSVPFEIDGEDPRRVWSVVARGDVVRSDDRVVLAVQREPGLRAWVADGDEDRDVLAVLAVTEVSGLEAARAVPAPERLLGRPAG